MDSDTAFFDAGTENRMIAIIPLEGVALAAAFAQACKTVVGMPVVPASNILTNISANSTHLPQVGRRGPASGLRQGAIEVMPHRGPHLVEMSGIEVVGALDGAVIDPDATLGR